MSELAIVISGLVELVGVDRIKPLAIRNEDWHLEAVRLQSTGQGRIYLTPSKNVQFIAVDACCLVAIDRESHSQCGQ